MENNIKTTIVEELLYHRRSDIELLPGYHKKLSHKEVLINFIDRYVNKEGDWIPNIGSDSINTAYYQSFLNHLKINDYAAYCKFQKSYDPRNSLHVAQDFMLLYDAYTGNHDPKLFKIDDDLWYKLKNTDLSKVPINSIKMPYDTMIVTFPKHYIKFEACKLEPFGTEKDDKIHDKPLDGYFDTIVVTTDGCDFNFYFPIKDKDNNTFKLKLNEKILPSLFIFDFRLSGTDLQVINKEVNDSFERFKNNWNDNKSITMDNLDGSTKEIMLGFFNLLLYINSVNKNVISIKVPVKHTLPNRPPLNTKFETFYVKNTININNHTNPSKGDGTKIMLCPKWDVRGHWRNQPCGPNRASNKWIWIEPHTKGIFREDKNMSSVPRDYTILHVISRR